MFFKNSCSKSCFSKLTSKAKKNFNFDVYMRTMLEAFQFIALWSTSEIYVHTRNRISLVFAYLLLLFWLLLIWVLIYDLFRRYINGKSYDESIHNSLNYSRRLILVCIVVFIRDNLVTILIFTSAQIIYLIVMGVYRPLNSKKDTIIDLFNEIIFSCLSASLIYFRTESAWNEVAEKAFMYTIMLNTLGVTIILIVFLTINLCQKWSKKKWNKVEIDPNQTTSIQKAHLSGSIQNNGSSVASNQSFVGDQTRMDFYKNQEIRIHSVKVEENKNFK